MNAITNEAGLAQFICSSRAAINAKHDGDLSKARVIVDTARQALEAATAAFAQVQADVVRKRNAELGQLLDAAAEISERLLTGYTDSGVAEGGDSTLLPSQDAPSPSLRDEAAPAGAKPADPDPTPSQTEEAAPTAGSSSGVAPAVEDTGHPSTTPPTNASPSPAGQEQSSSQPGPRSQGENGVAPTDGGTTGHPLRQVEGGAAAEPHVQAEVERVEKPAHEQIAANKATGEKKPCPRCGKPVQVNASGEFRSHMKADGSGLKCKAPEGAPAPEELTAKTQVDEQAGSLF